MNNFGNSFLFFSVKLSEANLLLNLMWFYRPLEFVIVAQIL